LKNAFTTHLPVLNHPDTICKEFVRKRCLVVGAACQPVLKLEKKNKKKSKIKEEIFKKKRKKKKEKEKHYKKKQVITVSSRSILASMSCFCFLLLYPDPLRSRHSSSRTASVSTYGRYPSVHSPEGAAAAFGGAGAALRTLRVAAYTLRSDSSLACCS
jgi:hypothetical protein